MDSADIDRDGHADILASALDRYVRVLSGRRGSVLQDFRYVTSTFKGFGASLAFVGDVDRDGHDDYVVGAMNEDSNGRYSGTVYVFSGKDGKVLTRILGDTWSGLGTRVAALGDVDKDGHPDFVASAPGGYDNRGAVIVWSGRDWRRLMTVQGTQYLETLGRELGGAGDYNRDGWPDFVAVGFGDTVVDDSHAHVFSGRDGSILRTFRTPPKGYTLFRSIANAGDLDRDGYPDLALGLIGGSIYDSMVAVVSVKDGSLLRLWAGDRPHDLFGYSIAATGDVDGDGYPDLLVGAPAMTPYPTGLGYGKIVSGKTGQTLLRIAETKIGYLGYATASGDVDGDGVRDVILGAPSDDTVPTRQGSVRVHSSRLLPLASDTHWIPLATGGEQQLELVAGAMRANRLYVLLGSQSGTKPGLMLGSVRLPLNLDGYLALTLQVPNAFLRPSIGMLDAAGNAQARLSLPPLSTSLDGTLLHHAYVVLSASLQAELASNPVPVSLIK